MAEERYELQTADGALVISGTKSECEAQLRKMKLADPDFKAYVIRVSY